jgi:hypothetical protein
MHLISDKERLENIKESDIIDAIKGLVGKSETYHSHVDETAIIADVNWLIEQAEKVERYEKALKWIVENFDSDKSGLSDEEYHKEMIKKSK